MVTYDQLDSDGREFADDAGDSFVSETFNQDNYDKQAENSVAAANGEDGFQSATGALAEALGVSESQLSSYDEKYVRRTEQAAEQGKYQRGLERSGVDDPSAWRDRWLSGLE